MASFDEIWSELKSNIIKYSEDNWSDFKDEAINDGKDFLDKSKDDLKRWSELLAQGKITKDDFEWLLLGRKDLAVMDALKQKGMAKKKLDTFAKGILETVKTTVVGFVQH
jgi:hypothetical protein